MAKKLESRGCEFNPTVQHLRQASSSICLVSKCQNCLITGVGSFSISLVDNWSSPHRLINGVALFMPLFNNWLSSHCLITGVGVFMSLCKKRSKKICIRFEEA